MHGCHKDGKDCGEHSLQEEAGGQGDILAEEGARRWMQAGVRGDAATESVG